VAQVDPQRPGVPGDPLEKHPLIVGHHSSESFTDSLLAFVHHAPKKGFYALLMVGLAGSGLFFFAITYTFVVGVGAWGNNMPVAWAMAITNFVWWIGIGHAGTLISAILLLFEQKWRNSINRFAEAMTLFAVTCAGLMPVLHLGRPQYFYWLVPYPSVHRIWPQFKSALTWDIAAVGTYFTVSLLFWYLGLIPDLATARDTAKSPLAQKVYGLFALGWRGAARHWHHWKIGYLLLGGLATPLVVSVHTIVSFDFAIAQLPGWHTTIFPPYFVAGAIFSGFALVLTLLIPARRALGVEHVVTRKHIDVMNKILLVTGLVVAYGYLQEHFMAWYSGNPYEEYTFANKRTGPYSPLFWAQIFCNVLVPQLLWSPRLRQNVGVTWIVAVVVNIGMWLERFVIVVEPLSRDFLPSSWHQYSPTWVDWSILSGSICFFGTLFLLFLKFIPPIPIYEVKELQHELEEAAKEDAAWAERATQAKAAPGEAAS